MKIYFSLPRIIIFFIIYSGISIYLNYMLFLHYKSRQLSIGKIINDWDYLPLDIFYKNYQFLIIIAFFSSLCLLVGLIFLNKLIRFRQIQVQFDDTGITGKLLKNKYIPWSDINRIALPNRASFYTYFKKSPSNNQLLIYLRQPKLYLNYYPVLLRIIDNMGAINLLRFPVSINFDNLSIDAGEALALIYKKNYLTVK